MKKKTLTAVPVLAEPPTLDETSGEARESTTRSNERSSETHSAGILTDSRGGSQYIQELESGELADGAGTYKNRYIYTKPPHVPLKEWTEACERAKRASDYATMFPGSNSCASQQVYQSPLWQWENRVKPFDRRGK